MATSTAKARLILHSLRYLIGDDAFFRALHRMAYPTKEMEKLTDGRQERLVNTDDFLNDRRRGIEDGSRLVFRVVICVNRNFQRL
jgi:hypothetical protein